MKTNPAKPAMRAMCKPLRVSASGCDDWLERPACAQAQAGAELPERIRQVHAASAATCGVPRGQAALADPGIRAGHKRIAATLRAHGLHGASRRGGWCVTDQRAKAQRPHRTWCSATSPPRASTRCGRPTSSGWPMNLAARHSVRDNLQGRGMVR